jgi:adenine deaminase
MLQSVNKRRARVESVAKRVRVAQKRQPADLLLKNGILLNVFTGEWLPGNIAASDGIIAGVGDYGEGKLVFDANGRYVVPGFINAHCHVESSMIEPGRYCAEELRHGVTTVITDPHEVANVAGADGIRYMLDAVAGLPINYYVQVPSCVPATPFEHSGAVLGAAKIRSLLKVPQVLGLGEMMNYPGVLAGDPKVLLKLDAARDRAIDGHAPGLSGYALQGYLAAGISTDHESIDFTEALEKLRGGMAILIREGSASQNLEALLRGAIARNIPTGRMAFCTDDKHLSDMRREGTIRHCVQKAIALGLSAAQAYAMASYNAAIIFGLKGLGAIAPGFTADLLVLDDRETVTLRQVFKAGEPLAAEKINQKFSPPFLPPLSVHLPPLNRQSFALPDYGETYPVINLVRREIVTRRGNIARSAVNAALAEGGLCKIAVVERHRASGNIGVGLLSGYGLRTGAIASTVGHDSHNLIVVGKNDDDMLLAAQETQKMGGGYTLSVNGQIRARVALPIYGLMRGGDAEQLIADLDKMNGLLHELGVGREIDPLVTLSFLSLPVIPEIRITDMGMFDVTNFRFIAHKR